MSTRLRVAGDTVAVWKGAEDTAPFDDPEANLARVKFHNKLRYISVQAEHVVTVALPARGGGLWTGNHLMFAHGLPGIPLVFASCTVGGHTIAFTGSIPVQTSASFPPHGARWARWVTVGADATNVYAFEYGRLPSGYNIPALNLDITTWVTDRVY